MRSEILKRILAEMDKDPWHVKLRRWWRVKLWTWMCLSRWIWDSEFKKQQREKRQSKK